jgi:hypothetical protein
LWPGFPVRARAGDALGLFLADTVRTDPPNTVRISINAERAPPAVITLLAPHFGDVHLDTLVNAVGVVGREVHRVWLLRDWRGSWPNDR